MLARSGEPFDSEEHLFELKWDGFRAIALRDASGVRLRSRRDRVMEPRYPEAVTALEALPPGTVLDGELVTLVDGRPDFEALLPREQATSPQRIARLALEIPVVYVAFDVLYEGYESTMDQPLHERRRRLTRLVPPRSGRLVLSDAVEGAGLALYESARERELEGIVAKELSSPYEPGLRSGAWTKCKPTQELPCVVIGYLEAEGERRSLVVAAEEGGVLVSVGRVASGLTTHQRSELLADLSRRRIDEPIVSVPDAPGPPPLWVDPGPMLVVRFVERTRAGNLRAPVVARILS
jgi:bifunctional non-homologous end joining protein LigD/DNA ligase-1